MCKGTEVNFKAIPGRVERAPWKSQDRISKLRADNCCFRCEKKGCYSRICSLLPPEGVKRQQDASIPTRVFIGPHGRPLRAKWKTPEQIVKLQKDFRCYRCERQGCNTRICPLLPAINPKFKVAAEYVPKKQLESIIQNKPLEISIMIGQEHKMNTSPFLVNVLINDLTMVQALVDNGCLCSGIIDDTLATQLNLPREAISPRQIETAEKSSFNKPMVKDITYVSIDLDGNVTKKLWLYIVPFSTHQMILGKKMVRRPRRHYSFKRTTLRVTELWQICV